METLAAKFFSAIFLTIFGGGWTLPLGLPPAPEDPALARVAPEKCLFYVSWAGMAAPDAKSENQTEQLLAEPEVQRSFATLATLLSNAVATVPADIMDPGKSAAPQTAMDLAKIIATHPGAAFATQIKTNKDGAFQNFRGGMIVAAGQDAEKLRAAFEQFRKEVTAVEPGPSVSVEPKPLAKTRPIAKEVQIAGGAWYRFTVPAPSSFPPVTCGFQGTDFILGIGDGSAEEIVKRRQQEPPAWLVALRKQLPVERVSTVVYLNLKLLLEQMAADKALPKTREALHHLGLDKLSALSSVSGLEGESFASKLLLSTDGEPQGPLLSLFSDQPLRAGDLAPIPCDATLGFAMRFDAQKAVDQFAAMVEKFDPARRTAVEHQMDDLTKSLQVDLRRELPKAMGDNCCVYSSPGEGGLLLLGLTAVVPIRNRDVVSVMQAKILGSSMAKSFQSAVTKDPRVPFQSPTPRLQSCDFAGQKIFYFTNMGLAPAWCATDRELIVALLPQNIMAYLQHGPAHKSIAAVSQVSRSISNGDAPSMLLYVDTAKLFELAYPFVPLVASYVMSAFGAEKQPLSLDSIPSAPAIRRHMAPGTAALRRTKQGLELISRQPLPGTGLLWTAAVAMQSPQSVEQEIEAEGRPKPETTFFGTAPVPGPAPAPPTEAQPLPGPAVGGTYAPAPTYSTPSTYSSAPVPGVAAPVPAQPPAAWDPYVPSTVGPAPPGVYAPAPAWLATEGRLRAVGAGVKAYRKEHHTMPPAYLADKQGKPLLSWRVALLPYLGQYDLYQRFHVDEPWDSPHNRQLIPLMPNAYQEPNATTPNPYAAPAKETPAKEMTVKDTAGTTRFLLVRGPKTVYADPTPPMPRTYEEWVKVIVVQVVPERAVPWTKPEEFTYNAEDPGAGLVADKSGNRLMLMACGAVAITAPPPLADKSRAMEELFTGEEPTGTPPPYVFPSPYAPTPAPPRLAPVPQVPNPLAPPPGHD